MEYGFEAYIRAKQEGNFECQKPNKWQIMLFATVLDRKLKGKGLNGNPAGDQLVILKVTLPKQHAEAAESLYRQVAELEQDFNPRAQLDNEPGA